MSPEMIEGKGLDLPTIDYWALGVIFFELIVGVPPFNDETIEKVFQNIKDNRVPWDSLITEDGEELISQEAKSLILGLLESNPNDRLGSDSVDDIKYHPFFAGSI